MKVTRLKVTNLRVIDAAEFRFQAGFNLLVGINGVGKTSVLDALSACLSPIVKRMNHLGGKALSLSTDDIRIGADALTVECNIEIGGNEYTYIVHRPRETSVPRQKSAGMPREQVHDTPRKSEFIGASPKPVTGREGFARPLALMFSTRRAVPSDRAPTKGASGGHVRAAFSDALANRELCLGEFADWMRVQKALKSESPSATHILEVFESTVGRFLPEYSNLRIVGETRPTL